ncbi:hypothetical protein G723_04773 [Escherichia coli HVH 50 (4-2593475)]|nr:hypothetical protein G723_04773 [Escherichia coli HVH 50 (4-2593475)]
MHRIDTKTAQKDKFGAGKNGFTRGNPQTGTPATDLDDDYFDMLQEELCSVVEASGASLEKARHDQLLTALRALLLSRKNPFGDIKSDGTVKTALENLGISNAVIGDGVNVIGFSKGVINKPYFRHQDTDTVILLTTQEELSTALAEKQDSNDTLSALANLIATTNKLPYFNNENSADLTDFTKVGRDIIGKSSIHDVIQYLELDDMVTGDGASVIGFSRNDATKPYMRHAQSDSVVALATASQLIGIDQTYQIVTDKYPGITYTNTSKQPWVISLKVNLPASGEVQIKVNGVMAAGGNTPNYAGVSSWVYPCAIVPPGANYMVELSFGNVIEWIELK